MSNDLDRVAYSAISFMGRHNGSHPNALIAEIQHQSGVELTFGQVERIIKEWRKVKDKVYTERDYILGKLITKTLDARAKLLDKKRRARKS